MKKKVYAVEWVFWGGDRFLYHAKLSDPEVLELEGMLQRLLNRGGEIESFHVIEQEKILSMAAMMQILREDFPGPRDWMPEKK